VVRVARERDDVSKPSAAGVPAGGRRFGSVTPVSLARAIEDGGISATGRLAAATPGIMDAQATRDSMCRKGERRIRLERTDHAVRHASFIATNPLERKTARARCKSPTPAGSHENARGPADAVKRRSGIVRRLAAPDSASPASERCRGRKPQERRSAEDVEAPYAGTSAGVMASRQAEPVVSCGSSL